MNKVWGRFGSPAAPVWPPRPVDRGSLFARSGPLRGPARRSAPGARVDARHAAQAIHALPALTRAQNNHVLLVETAGRPARLTATGTTMLRLELFRSHASDWAMVVPGRGLRRAAHAGAAARSTPATADRAEEQPPGRNDADRRPDPMQSSSPRKENNLLLLAKRKQATQSQVFSPPHGDGDEASGLFGKRYRSQQSRHRLQFPDEEIRRPLR